MRRNIHVCRAQQPRRRLQRAGAARMRQPQQRAAGQGGAGAGGQQRRGAGQAARAPRCVGILQLGWVGGLLGPRVAPHLLLAPLQQPVGGSRNEEAGARHGLMSGQGHTHSRGELGIEGMGPHEREAPNNEGPDGAEGQKVKHFTCSVA